MSNPLTFFQTFKTRHELDQIQAELLKRQARVEELNKQVKDLTCDMNNEQARVDELITILKRESDFNDNPILKLLRQYFNHNHLAELTLAYLMDYIWCQECAQWRYWHVCIYCNLNNKIDFSYSFNQAPSLKEIGKILVEYRKCRNDYVDQLICKFDKCQKHDMKALGIDDYQDYMNITCFLRFSNNLLGDRNLTFCGQDHIYLANELYDLELYGNTHEYNHQSRINEVYYNYDFD